ncbi:hypothetical protein VTI74DRAFT_1366 [Chaetomium olivicolor]
MPSATQESPLVHSSKKRRRDDIAHQIPLSAGLLGKSTLPSDNGPIFDACHAINHPHDIFAQKVYDHGHVFHHHHSSPLATRKIAPLPSAKRRRTSVDLDIGLEPMQRSPSNSPSRRHRQETHHQTPRDETRPIPTPPAPAPAPAPAPITTTTTSASLMNRCHICSRKPQKKSDLDSFADCEGCGQRSCYVCIRECLGWGPNPPTETNVSDVPPLTTSTATSEDGDASFTMLDADADVVEDHSPLPPPPPLPPQALPRARTVREGHGWTRGGGHRQMVCSRCCVEKGQDGDVVCLGCLPFVEG